VSLETLPENSEWRCWGKVRRKTIPKIGGEDWFGSAASNHWSTIRIHAHMPLYFM